MHILWWRNSNLTTLIRYHVKGTNANIWRVKNAKEEKKKKNILTRIDKSRGP